MGNAVVTDEANGTGRAFPSSRPVLLSPIHLRRPTLSKHSVSPTFSYSHTEYEDGEEEDWSTPSPARESDMDMNLSGGYGADNNTSSEVDDDMDFYEADLSQPTTMANAVRFLISPSLFSSEL